jgi:hypothetical protein
MNGQLEKAKKLEEETRKVFSLAGKSLTEKAPLIYADKSGKFAFWCFIIGMIWMGLVFIVIFSPILMYMWKEGVNYKIDWLLICYRAVSSFILLLPSFYLLKENKKHRAVEQKYRELQIKLSGVKGYFEFIGNGVSKQGQTITDKDLVQLEIGKSLLSPSRELGKDDIVGDKSTLEFIEKMVEIVISKITR